MNPTRLLLPAVLLMIGCPTPDPTQPVDRSDTGTPTVTDTVDPTTLPDDCEGLGEMTEAEPNDDENTPTRVSSGEPIKGTIGVEGDEDWFVIESCGERVLTMTLTNAPAFDTPVQYDLQLFDAEMNQINREFDINGADGTTELSTNHYLPQQALYYVRVADRLGTGFDDAQSYTLTLTARPVPDGEAEPNGNSSNPQEIQANATELPSGVGVTGFIASEGDDDWYALTVTGESVVRFSLTNMPAFDTPVQFDLRLYDTNAETELNREFDIDGTDGTTELESQHYLPGAGTYYFRVLDRTGDAFDYDQGYTLTVTELIEPDADVEPNGNTDNPQEIQATATPVSSGVPFEGFVASEGDDDWYALDVTGEAIVQFELSNAPAITTPVQFDLRLYDTDADTQLNREFDLDGTDGTTELFTLHYVPSAGTYYVRVMDRTGPVYDYDQGYEVTVTELLVPDGAQEPNGNGANPDERRAIASPAAGSATGTIGSEGDEDCYAVGVGGAGTLSVSLTNAPAISTPVQYELVIYDTDGATQLDRQFDSNGADGTTNLTATASVSAGTYYACVRDRIGPAFDYDQGFALTITAP